MPEANKPEPDENDQEIIYYPGEQVTESGLIVIGNVDLPQKTFQPKDSEKTPAPKSPDLYEIKAKSEYIKSLLSHASDIIEITIDGESGSDALNFNAWARHMVMSGVESYIKNSGRQLYIEHSELEADDAQFQIPQAKLLENANRYIFEKNILNKRVRTDIIDLFRQLKPGEIISLHQELQETAQQMQ